MGHNTPSADDWKSMATLLADAAEADSADELIGTMIRQAHALFPAEIVICDRFDERARQVAFQMYPAPTPEFVQKTHAPFMAFWHQHPCQGEWVQTFGAGNTVFLSDRISGREFRRTDLWNEVYIHLRAKNQILVGGRIEPDRYWCLSLNRLGSGFGPRDRELCRFLQPRITRLLQRHAGRCRANRAAAALEHATAAYLVVEGDGRVAEVSDGAHALLTQPGSITAERLAVLARRAARPGLHWLAAENVRAFSFRAPNQTTALVLLGEALKTPAAEERSLTMRESEILHWLGEGKTNAEMAAVFGVSPRTVEKHCERLFAKLGVENRLAAALLARQLA